KNYTNLFNNVDFIHRMIDILYLRMRLAEYWINILCFIEKKYRISSKIYKLCENYKILNWKIENKKKVPIFSCDGSQALKVFNELLVEILQLFEKKVHF